MKDEYARWAIQKSKLDGMYYIVVVDAEPTRLPVAVLMAEPEQPVHLANDTLTNAALLSAAPTMYRFLKLALDAFDDDNPILVRALIQEGIHAARGRVISH